MRNLYTVRAKNGQYLHENGRLELTTNSEVAMMICFQQEGISIVTIQKDELGVAYASKETNAAEFPWPYRRFKQTA